MTKLTKRQREVLEIINRRGLFDPYLNGHYYTEQPSTPGGRQYQQPRVVRALIEKRLAILNGYRSITPAGRKALEAGK